MANIPARHLEKSDLNSADDMRNIGAITMLVGAIVAILAMMAIVYWPKMWGIERFGSDVTGNSATGHSSVQRSAEGH